MTIYTTPWAQPCQRALHSRRHFPWSCRLTGLMVRVKHITLGYCIKPSIASEEQRCQKRGLQAVGELRRRVPVIELGAPEYCPFDSTSEFSTQFPLA